MLNSALKGMLAACTLALSGVAFATVSNGALLGNACTGCHGTNGNSSGPAIPTIAGISSEYLIESMKGFRDGTLPSTIMGRIARGYDNDEIEALAGFFAKQEFKPAIQKSDAALADRGAKLHKRYCEKCHAEGGTSSEDDAGILAGQWLPYLKNTLSDFMAGYRDMSRKMKRKTDELKEKHGDEGFELLMNFYASRKKEGSEP
jgi:sulfide dehydrogenase cytochrome subunit